MTSPLTFSVTGATGSFGSSLVRHLLHTTPHRVRIISRDEDKQERMMRQFPPDERTTYILCDVRDAQRLTVAFRRSDVIVHAAALKRVPFGEVHTDEFFKTNVLGTTYAIGAAIANADTVKKFLFISSDKSVQALNAYGRTKSLAEALVTSANQYGHGIKFSSVRGGNVWLSRGSVVEQWLSQNPIRITDPAMTRFHLPMDYWLGFCLRAIENTHGGEVFIPKCDGWTLENLSTAFCEVYRDKTVEVIGARAGEKLHETLISNYEAASAVDLGWGYAIQPSANIREVWNYTPHTGKPVYGEVSSDKTRKLSVDELRSLINKTL